MNKAYGIGAAVAGLICMSSATALASDTLVGTSQQGGVQILHVSVNGSVVDVQNNATATYGLATIPPPTFPADPCRAVIVRWNIAVAFNAGQARFEALFRALAQHQCPVTIIFAGLNLNGTRNLISAKPGT